MRTIRRRPRIRFINTAILICGLALLGSPWPAHADTVKLANGDVITGKVKKLAEGKLVIKTDYAGELSIDTKHIVAVDTEAPFTVRWDDGSEKVGRLAESEGKTDIVATDAPPPTDEIVADTPKTDPTKLAADAPTTDSTEVATENAAPTELTQDADAAEAEAETVLAELEPTDAPDEELTEAKEAASASTAAATEYALEKGLPTPVASEVGEVNMAKVDWIKPIKPYYRYEGSFNVGLNAARGNTDTTDVHIDGKIAPSFGRNTIAIGGDYNKSEADGVVNKSNWTIQAEYDREFGVRRRWFGTVFNTYQNDELADLNLRITAGAGVGYKFFNQRPTLLKISLGPAYVNEDFATDLDRTFLGLRWALNFEQDLWSEDFLLYHNDTMTFGVSQTQFVLKTATGVKMKLIADFTIAAELRYDYNAEPPPDTLKTDTYYILKIGYDFRGDETDWFPQW
ncbi:MAG: DUF481 domain-containing protein [Candidatus Binatia bacterium]|nr:DUF481 domain-containing protein [Candidatus Binatia bacterium]